MKLSELAHPAGCSIVGPDPDLPLAVRVDSREVEAGQGFAALRGARTDGHRFIPDVLKKGASLIVCEKESFQEEWSERFPHASFLLTGTRCEYALAEIASCYIRRLPALKDLIAITGSVGKTSTKNNTRVLLEKHYKVHCAGRNYNTLIGCAVSVLSAPVDTEILLLEMGANHFGEIAEMVRYMPPTIAAITEIAPAHLENFGSLEGVCRAKREILASSALRAAVLNGDNACLREGLHDIALPETVFFGRHGSVSFAKESLRWEKNSFIVSAILTDCNGISFKISLPLAGIHQLYPVCCAVAIAEKVGLSCQAIAEELPGCRNTSGRGEILFSSSGAAILDECYNASPLAVMAALASMSAGSIPGRRFLVLGEMLELGEESAKLHEAVFKRAAGISENIFLLGESWEGIPEAVPYLFADAEGIIQAIDARRPGEGDVILVKGSRGNHLEQVVKAIEL